MSLKTEVLNRIDPETFFRDEFPEWSGKQNDLVECPRGERHQDGEDSTSSLQLDPLTGQFVCHGCGFKGTSVLGYYTDIHCGGSYSKALSDLHHRYIGKLPDLTDIKKAHRRLLSDGELLSDLLSIRGWTEETIRKLRLGWSDERLRVAIPIFSSGVCVDVRWHDALRRAPKSKRGRRAPIVAEASARNCDVYPIIGEHDPFSGDTVWIFEGEPDVVFATQMGLPAITFTGGAGQISNPKSGHLNFFRGKNVIVCLDSDEAGKGATAKLLQKLAGSELRSCKALHVPKGKDLTEYMLRYRGSKEALQQLVDNTPFVIPPADRVVQRVTLADSSKPEFVHKKVAVGVLVNGKDEAPLTVAKRIQVRCFSKEKCANCPSPDGSPGEHAILREDPNILEWALAQDLKKQVKQDRNLRRTCSIDCQVLDWQSIEPMHLIPSLAHRESDNQFVTRRGYYLGHGIDSNHNYEAIATPTPHPRTKQNVLLLQEMKSGGDTIRNFKLSEADEVRLREAFEGARPAECFLRVTKHYSRCVTRIIKRADLHAGVDLCFHSVRGFNFLGTDVRKATLDVAIFGDTRCGKGQVAERIAEYYDLGSTVSGENASFMGLVGGAQKSEAGFSLVWGRIPTSNGRLLIIDEVSGFADMGKLSRIRSEGVAELDKGGIHSSTEANTRLIWIANPRKGLQLSQHSSGVEAFAKFVGANEDVARFDYVVFAAKDEVPVSEINQIHQEEADDGLSRDMLRKLVLWAWSRTPDQVVFEHETCEYILEQSVELSQRYVSSIPLIQGESVRFKIAKIAAAVAARCFSSPDGQRLVVKKEHAKFAINFLHRCYTKQAAGYARYSELEISRRELQHPDELEQMFTTFDEPSIVVEGMLSAGTFGSRDMQDWTGADAGLCRQYVGLMVRSNAIRKQYGNTDSYIMMPNFREWLRKWNGQTPNFKTR